MRKRALLGLAFLLMISCTACGDAASDMGFVMNGGGSSYESAESAPSYKGDYAYDYGADSGYEEPAEDVKDSIGSGQNQDISLEMLVYTCNMTIDVLGFEDAVTSFRARLNEFGGFVESEDYSDNGSYNRYYDRKAEVWHKYTARVRVPSSRYEEFCSGVSSIGDLRSKNAYVENVSQEYSDAKTALEIYEAKQTRYIELLATVEDDMYALEIERELTDIQIAIAKLKTRMNKMERDVAYSYVNVTINEVKEYQEEPLKTDTFLQRLENEVKGTWENFLDFLEGLLFFLINSLPYLLLLIVILVLFKLLHVTDRIRDKHFANKQKRLEREAYQAQQLQLRQQQFQQQNMQQFQQQGQQQNQDHNSGGVQ